MKRINCFAIAFALSTVASLGAAADPSGFYVGLGWSQIKVGGDFDGTSFLSGGGSVEIMPTLDAAHGLNFAIGGLHVERRMLIGAEMSYESSSHDGQWGGFPVRSKFSELNFDFYAGGPSVPYLRWYGLMGIGFPEVRVEQGSSDGTDVADAKFTGYGLRLGAGILVPLHKHVAATLQVVKRFDKYTKDSGIASGTCDVKGHGTTWTLGVKGVF